jgi:hypothetical protein
MRGPNLTLALSICAHQSGDPGVSPLQRRCRFTANPAGISLTISESHLALFQQSWARHNMHLAVDGRLICMGGPGFKRTTTSPDSVEERWVTCNLLTEMCSGSEAGSCLRLIDFCAPKLINEKRRRPARRRCWTRRSWARGSTPTRWCSPRGPRRPKGRAAHGVVASGLVLGGYHDSTRCSRDTYPESYITRYTIIGRLPVHPSAP